MHTSNFRMLKVLPLDAWMSYCDEEELRDMAYTEVSPRFNRDGQYFMRDTKTWWFEVNGKAYTSERDRSGKHFLYQVKLDFQNILSRREVKAMRTVLATTRDPLVRKALKSRLHIHEETRLIRECGRDSRLSMARFKKFSP